MKTPLVDHLWTKIVESSDIAIPAVEHKLQQLEDIETAISRTDGSDAVRNVLANGTIRRALERALAFHRGAGDIDLIDLQIYYEYATAAAKESQRIIDAELAYLGL